MTPGISFQCIYNTNHTSTNCITKHITTITICALIASLLPIIYCFHKENMYFIITNLHLSLTNVVWRYFVQPWTVVGTTCAQTSTTPSTEAGRTPSWGLMLRSLLPSCSPRRALPSVPSVRQHKQSVICGNRSTILLGKLKFTSFDSTTCRPYPQNKSTLM